MRYFTWKLDWSSGVGTDPTSSTNSETIRLEPAFSTGSVADPSSLIYGYWVSGEPDLAQLTTWQFSETTLDAMLAAAQVLNPLASSENGLILFPRPNEMP